MGKVIRQYTFSGAAKRWFQGRCSTVTASGSVYADSTEDALVRVRQIFTRDYNASPHNLVIRDWNKHAVVTINEPTNRVTHSFTHVKEQPKQTAYFNANAFGTYVNPNKVFPTLKLENLHEHK